MKRIALILIQAVVAVTMVAGNVSAADTLNIREQLVKSEATEAVYAIDDYHTFVVGGAAETKKMIGKELNVIKEYGADDSFKTGAIMIKHENAQQYVFKNQSEEVAMPENGDFTLDGSVTSLFQRMTTLCRESKGTATFVIPKIYGNHKRLTEVSVIEAFNYMATAGTEDNGWLMACSGNAKFMVEKNFQSITRNIETASFYAGRMLEGVSYVKVAEAADVKVPERKPMIPAIQAQVREQMAREIADIKMNFVKSEAGVKFIGLYKGESNNAGCAVATVKEVERPLSRKQYQAKVYDYKVCGSNVAELAERSVQVVSDGTASIYNNTGNVFVASWINVR
ncbi:hypothetical protein EPN18_04005 [bacterium]|nr:MAG: hypothetical protein EPN18_04005 [bacterium]